MKTHREPAGAATVHLIPVLEDNYLYLLSWPSVASASVSESDQWAAIDTATAKPIKAAISSQGGSLAYILNTHAHFDHIAGNQELKNWSGAKVFGPATERIPGLDTAVHDGDQITIGPLQFDIIETPGHTRNDISYYEPEHRLLFCGDTLFAGGCGRLFEGTADQLWQSLCKLRALPDETRVFFGHEYTRSNLLFAVDQLPEISEFRLRLEAVERVLKQGQLSAPTTIGEEKQSNIFMRCDDPVVLQALGMQDHRPEVVFAELRERKNRFRG